MASLSLNDDEKKQLVSKAPAHIALANDIHHDIDLMQWWRQNRSVLPNFTRLAFRAMLVQPSSACVERAFSQLRNLLTDRQEQTVEDAVELSVMIAFNEALLLRNMNKMLHSKLIAYRPN